MQETMRMVTGREPDRDPLHVFSSRRVIIIALVVSMHGLLALLLLRPVTPWLHQVRPYKGTISGNDVLTITLLEPVLTAADRSSPSAELMRHGPGYVEADAPPKHQGKQSTAPRPPPEDPLSLTLDVPKDYLGGGSAPVPATPQFIAGGRSFQGSLRAAARPGQELLPDYHDPHVPRLAMRDLQSEGVAGFLQKMGGLFGAVNPACLKADAYRGMSDVELEEHNTSRSAVENTVAAYGCPG